MSKMKTLHIFTSFWKRRAIRKALQKAKDADLTRRFAFVEMKEKNKFVASVFEEAEGESLKEELLKIHPKAIIELR
jgi:hypothetical protein